MLKGSTPDPVAENPRTVSPILSSAVSSQSGHPYPIHLENPRSSKTMGDLVGAKDIKRSLNPMPLLKYSTVESMEDYLNYRECHREFDGVKEVPPLALIFLRSYMERAWTWKRLVPWTVGCVELKDYMDYLKMYLEKNDFVRPDVCAEAKRCLKVEKKYVNNRVGLLSEKDASLSCNISELAEKMRDSGSLSVTAAAGFKCIAAEARLMSNFGTCTKMFKFSNEVRRSALNLMMYAGPESQSVAAGMLGMGKEARIAHKLLKTIGEPESFESLEVCKVVRDCTLNVLIHLERNVVSDGPATSSTDQTEGYAISENSADDEFAGNKNSMDTSRREQEQETKVHAGDQRHDVNQIYMQSLNLSY